MSHTFDTIRSSLDWPWACCRSSCANIIWLYCTSRRASKSSSIWPESGLKRRSPGSEKHMLIRSTIVKIRTRRAPFWNSSVLAEIHQLKIHEQKFEEMEWSAGPVGSRANVIFKSCTESEIKENQLTFFLMFVQYKTFLSHYNKVNIKKIN